MLNLKKTLIDEYKEKQLKTFKEVKFLKKISKAKVFVTSTGIVRHIQNYDYKSSLALWDNKIFSKKIKAEDLKYSSDNAIMRSRHYYSAIFINELLVKKRGIKFCDYGSGEGNFISELARLNKNIKFYFTESSKINYSHIKKKYKKTIGFNGSIEDSITNKNFKNLGAASLLWTLSACVNPIGVLNAIHASLNKEGLLIISDSSRIMVPFKKPIYNFFNSKLKTNNSHPFFFSYNSLSNLLEICGFRIVKANRFYDENDLVVIAKKRNNLSKSKLKFDSQKRVISFLKSWLKFSILLKKNTNNYKN
jgi:2-polyprenyl-3-methyl-5-hydroxy-6-metoxy-1,4-benzoquinol methylase